MRRAKTLPLLALLLAGTALAGPALAQTVAPNTQPGNGAFVAGSGSIARTPTTTTVTQTTNRGVVQWDTMNVGSQQTLRFDQQAGNQSWTLNRVTGGDPSVIAGRITANGGIAIVNQSGVVFTEGAQVNVGSLIASASNITNDNFMAGRLVFDGAPRPGARVENRGTITVADQGIAALVGPEVANSGTINARLGRVALAGAETFTLDLAGDGLLAIDVTQAVRTAPNGGAAVVTNSGTIQADGGSVLLSASAASGLVETLVANTGTIQANTVGARTGQVALQATGGGTRTSGTITATGDATQRGGRIEVNATEQVTVASGAVVDASGGAGGGRVTVGAGIASQPGAPRNLARRTVVEQGAAVRADATNNGDGGTIIVHSQAGTRMMGSITAQGGPRGGDGGFVELSAHRGLVIRGTVATLAPAGRGGTLLIDPDEIYISQSGSNVNDPFVDSQSSLNEAGLNNLGLFNANLILSAVNRIWVGFTMPFLTGGFPAPSPGTVTYSSGNLTLQTTGAGSTLSISQPLLVANGNLTLQSTGPGATIAVNQLVTVTNGSLLMQVTGTGSYITVSSNVSVLSGDALLQATATAAGALVQVSASGSLAVNGTLTLEHLGGGGGNIRLWNLPPNTVAANRVVVNAADVQVQTLTNGQLIATGGDLVMTGSGASVFSLAGSLKAAGDIRITGTGSTQLGLAGSVDANSLTIVVPQFWVAPSGSGLPLAISVVRGALISSPSLSFAAPAGGGVNLLSFGPGAGATGLPVLVLDGRTTGLTSLPGFVQAVPSGYTAASRLAALQQFGTPSAGEAGPIQLSLDAGASPVVLLADGAAITGTVKAGHIGLLGTGGSASLTGSLNGLATSAAASLAQTLIGYADPLRQNYRFNTGVWQGVPDVTPPPGPVVITQPATGTPVPVVGSPVTPLGDTTATTGQAGGASVLYGPSSSLAAASGTAAAEALEARAEQPTANSYNIRFDRLRPSLQELPSGRHAAERELDVPNAGGRDY